MVTTTPSTVTIAAGKANHVPASVHRIATVASTTVTDAMMNARTAALRTRDWVEADYQFVVLRGVSHWAPEQAPESVAGVVLDRIRPA